MRALALKAVSINPLRCRRLRVCVLVPLDIYVEWGHSTSHSTFSLDVRRWLWPHRCEVVRWFGGRGLYNPLKHDRYDTQRHMCSIESNSCKTLALKDFAPQLRARLHRDFQLCCPNMFCAPTWCLCQVQCATRLTQVCNRALPDYSKA